MSTIYESKNVWSDEPSAADGYRRAYANGLGKYIENKIASARELRREYMPPEKLVENPEKYRTEYKAILGVPDFSRTPLTAEKELVGEDDFSQIYRIKILVTPEVPFYAMLLLPKGKNNTGNLDSMGKVIGTNYIMCNF